MSFQIKLYRRPGHENDLILIGIGQLESGTGTYAIPEPDESLHRAVNTIFKATSSDAPTDITFLETVRGIIIDSLRDGKPHLKSVAEVFGIGPRTLERRLSKTGVDFTKLVDETRRQLAFDLLAQPQNKLTDIALLLGYSEVSAFNRAFKRWTNSTPMSFRRTKLDSRRETAVVEPEYSRQS